MKKTRPTIKATGKRQRHVKEEKDRDDDIASYQAHLWRSAYVKVKGKEPKLMDAYEKIFNNQQLSQVLVCDNDNGDHKTAFSSHHEIQPHPVVRVTAIDGYHNYDDGSQRWESMVSLAEHTLAERAAKNHKLTSSRHRQLSNNVREVITSIHECWDLLGKLLIDLLHTATNTCSDPSPERDNNNKGVGTRIYRNKFEKIKFSDRRCINTHMIDFLSSAAIFLARSIQYYSPHRVTTTTTTTTTTVLTIFHSLRGGGWELLTLVEGGRRLEKMRGKVMAGKKRVEVKFEVLGMMMATDVRRIREEESGGRAGERRELNIGRCGTK